MSEQPDGEDLDPREQPSRYTRTANGLLAALLVTVLAVGAFVVFRGVFRDEPDVNAGGPVDYLNTVEGAQEGDVTLVYPSTLPKGWKTTSLDFVPGAKPAWGLGMLTADGKFVGLRQEDADVDELIEAYVDKNAEMGDQGSYPSDLSTGDWQLWADSGGDLAYSTTLTKGADSILGDTLLIYGSASRVDQEKLISLLTIDAVD